MSTNHRPLRSKPKFVFGIAIIIAVLIKFVLTFAFGLVPDQFLASVASVALLVGIMLSISGALDP